MKISNQALFFALALLGLGYYFFVYKPGQSTTDTGNGNTGGGNDTPTIRTDNTLDDRDAKACLKILALIDNSKYASKKGEVIKESTRYIKGGDTCPAPGAYGTLFDGKVPLCYGLATAMWNVYANTHGAPSAPAYPNNDKNIGPNGFDNDQYNTPSIPTDLNLLCHQALQIFNDYSATYFLNTINL